MKNTCKTASKITLSLACVAVLLTFLDAHKAFEEYMLNEFYSETARITIGLGFGFALTALIGVMCAMLGIVFRKLNEQRA